MWKILVQDQAEDTNPGAGVTSWCRTQAEINVGVVSGRGSGEKYVPNQIWGFIMCGDSFGNKEGAKSIVRNSRENLWIQVFLIHFHRCIKSRTLATWIALTNMYVKEWVALKTKLNSSMAL